MQVEDVEGAGSEEQLSLGDLGAAFARRWYVIAISLLLCMIAGVSAYKSEPRKYTATATVNITPPEHTSGVDLASVVSSGSSADLLETETAVLESETLAQATIDRLNLASNPHFMDSPYQNLPVTGWKNDPKVRSRAIAAWKQSIKVAVIGKTHLIEISATTHDPELAKDIANSLVDGYIIHNYESHYEVAQQASDWLGSQLAKLRQSAEHSQKDLLDYQRSSGLISGDKNGSLVIEQISDLTRSLTQAESDRILAESQFRLASGADRDVLTALYSDNVLQSLSSQRAALEQQIDADANRFGPKYPKMIADRQQLALLDNNISDRITSLRSAFKKRYDEATATERSFRDRLDAAKTAAYETSSSAVQLAIKQKEVEAANDLYQTVSARLQSAGVSAGLAATNVQRLDQAHLPAYPSSPQLPLFIGTSALLGLILGFACAYLMDRILDRIQSETRVEAILGIPLIGALPRVSTDALLHPGSTVRTSDASDEEGANYLEACRAIRSSILFSPGQGDVRTIVITSSGPGEGKSTVAENLASVFAREDRKVLLIDADLRRPVLAKRLGIQARWGLSDVLVGVATLEQAITKVPGHEGLSLFSAGTLSPRGGELLDSKKMASLLEALKQQFYMILIDTPPILMVTDATVVAKMAGELVVVTRVGVTREHALQEVRRLIRRSHIHMTGVILNASKTKTGYYSSRYYAPKEND